MKKLFLTFLICLLCPMPVNAELLKGGIEYTIDTARIAAFENTSMEVSKDEYAQYSDDFLTNLKAIHDGKFYINTGYNRRIVPFYENNKLSFYGVQYEDIPNKKFYYSKSGKLLKFDIIKNLDTYPHKALSITKVRL